MFLTALVAGLILFQTQPVHHSPSDPIDEDDLRQYLAKQNGCEYDRIYISKIEPYDFLGKGYPQFAVVASTCMTGTAGPDVHSVYTRNAGGELQELKIDTPKLPDVLFGNSNSTFEIENGLLIDDYGDTSERDHPLVVKYKWDAAKNQFTAVAIVAAKPYRTSYDCSKAQDTALAICYVEQLADLDVELADTYKSWISALGLEQRKAAIEEERAWLKQRDHECVIYKWWVDCLAEQYQKRITELRSKIAAAKKSASASPNSRP
jgi:uncharacterized protein YecT (DUF1311 family)